MVLAMSPSAIKRPDAAEIDRQRSVVETGRETPR